MTTDRGTAATEETVAVTIDLSKLDHAETRRLQEALFTDAMKRQIADLRRAVSSADSAVDDLERAIEYVPLAPPSDSDVTEAEADGEWELHRDPSVLAAALHSWHDAYHPGVFRLCREELCRDLGVSTSGPAPVLMAVAS